MMAGLAALPEGLTFGPDVAPVKGKVCVSTPNVLPLDEQPEKERADLIARAECIVSENDGRRRVGTYPSHT
jgi:hypothetical protein